MASLRGSGRQGLVPGRAALSGARSLRSAVGRPASQFASVVVISCKDCCRSTHDQKENDVKTKSGISAGIGAYIDTLS